MEKQDSIKQAFIKIKQDMLALSKHIENLNLKSQNITQEINNLNLFIQDTKTALNQIKDNQKTIYNLFEKLGNSQENTRNLLKMLQNNQKITQKALKKHISTHKQEKQTIRHITSTPSTDNLPLQAPKPQNMPISTGNRGVSTDRQTDRQTDKYAENELKIMKKNPKIQQKTQKTPKIGSKYNEQPENLLKIASGIYNQQSQLQQQITKKTSIQQASELLQTLDSLKKELRIKFKQLTAQEFKVFSAIYQLENQGKQVNYTLLSQQLNLTTSSIRDYIQRIISKGIPIIKRKINNKQVILNISQDLKKIASLPTILQLREI